MKLHRALLPAHLLPVLLLPSLLAAQPQTPQPAPQSPPIPTFRSTSTLVFLDVTVLDKNGDPVTKGLTRDDFTITQDNKPQRIFSFEPPEAHVLDKKSVTDNPDGRAPLTIFVLDLLNSNLEDSAYLRYEADLYLHNQPSRLASPAELIVVGNDSMQLVQGFTRRRDDLLFALKHIPAALPYKRMNGSFYSERFTQSIEALQQIAIQNRAQSGRKNIVWLGHGGPDSAAYRHVGGPCDVEPRVSCQCRRLAAR